MTTTETPAKRPAVFTTVSQLRPDTAGHNLKVKVVDAKVVVNKPGRVPQKIAECTIGDDTGVVVFTARNEQVDLARPGKSIILRNAKIDMYRGSMRLAVNQWGKVEETSGLDFEPRADNNLSLIEYELVQIPANVQLQADAAPQVAGPTTSIEA